MGLNKTSHFGLIGGKSRTVFIFSSFLLTYFVFAHAISFARGSMSCTEEFIDFQLAGRGHGPPRKDLFQSISLAGHPSLLQLLLTWAKIKSNNWKHRDKYSLWKGNTTEDHRFERGNRKQMFAVIDFRLHIHLYQTYFFTITDMSTPLWFK